MKFNVFIILISIAMIASSSLRAQEVDFLKCYNDPDSCTVKLKETPTATMKKSSPPSFQKGLDAYYSGDFATALPEFKPLAEQGHA